MPSARHTACLVQGKLSPVRPTTGKREPNREKDREAAVGVTISLRLDPEVLAAIDALAKREGTTRSPLIQIAVQRLLRDPYWK
jgi:hypothetical protein